MVFKSPSYIPALSQKIPTNVSLPDFLLNEQYGRRPVSHSRAPFVCGLSGQSYTASDLNQRVENLARAFSTELGWKPQDGTEWDKCVCIYTLNTIDTIPVSLAIHRLGGLSSPANAAYAAGELELQIRDSGAKCLVTCVPLLDTALQVAKKCQIPRERIYLLDTPPSATYARFDFGIKTIGQLITAGEKLPPVDRVSWGNDEGKQRIAFLCYSSGTSGQPKGVMLSHYNVISNILQLAHFERSRRKACPQEIGLGLLPFSHIYGLVVISLNAMYHGDSVIVLPKFDMTQFLEAIQEYRISNLFLVPPLIVRMIQQAESLSKYDLSSVKIITTGAAPLREDQIWKLRELWPDIFVRQGYGSTEACAGVSFTDPADVYAGSCGVLLTEFQAKLVRPDGSEIASYDTPGELLLKSPSIFAGYHKNETANKETFIDGWMRTGDEAVVRTSDLGHEHIFITDRIKEMIKVRGFQVAPAELEAHLLGHPSVADCVVIAVKDEEAGELPRAYVVPASRSKAHKCLFDEDEWAKRDIEQYVQLYKARHKWLKGGVIFIDEIPRAASGKILRRVLRDREMNSQLSATRLTQRETQIHTASATA